MRNRATHFVGIPVIVFSLLLILALVQFQIGSRETSLAAVAAHPVSATGAGRTTPSAHRM